MLLVKYTNPDGYVIVEGDLDKIKMSDYGAIKFSMPKSGKILIPKDVNCRIAFIRELTDEEYKKYQEADEKRKKQEEEERELQEQEREANIAQRKARLSFTNRKDPKFKIPPKVKN